MPTQNHVKQGDEDKRTTANNLQSHVKSSNFNRESNMMLNMTATGTALLRRPLP